MNIRRAKKNDLESVLTLETRSFRGGLGYCRSVFRQFLDAAPQLFLVAEDEGSGIVGYICAIPGTIPGEIWVLSLAVSPDTRSKGIARKLCETLRDSLKSTGIQCAYLTTSPENEHLLALAKSLQAEVVGREKDYFEVGEERLLLKYTF